MITINVFVAPRTKPYINDTIKSLRKAGFNQKIHISSEPETIFEPIENTEVFYNEERLGITLHWRETIKRLLQTTNDPWLMLVDDDIDCDPSSAKYINKFISTINRPIGYVSAYTPAAYLNTWPWLNEYNGWAKVNRGWDTWGSQCILMQRQTAKFLILAEKMKNAPKNFHQVDAVFGEFFEKCNLDCYYSVPSLFEHVGLWNSTINNPNPLNYGLRFGEPFHNEKGPILL